MTITYEEFAGFISELLLVGFEEASGTICLVTTTPTPPNGQKLN
jgi:tRNA-binding protein